MRLTAHWGAMAALCAVASFASAQSQSLTEQIIPASQRAHDFGAVARAATTEHRFEIRNPFKEPMHLSSISASCGCTTPIIETEWIQPGQVGTVLARFNTGTFSGDRKASLNLTIDRPNFMQLQLNVKGYIRTDIVINPGELNFGTVPVGESKEIEARIEYAGRSDWKITNISSNAQFITADIEELTRAPGRVSYKITAKLAPTDQLGSQSTMLTLQTNDNRLKSVPLACLAQIQAPLTASPTSLALGDIQIGKSIQQRILIKGTAPFKILSVDVPNFAANFEPSTEAKAVQFLNLTLTPNADQPAAENSGEVRTRMTIKTDLDGEKEIALDMIYKLKAENQTAADDAKLSKVSSRASFGKR